MPLPPLTVEARVAHLAPDLDFDRHQVEELIEIASAMARTHAGRDWVNDAGDLDGVPDGVPGVVASMVVRALRNPRGATQEATGPFSESYGPAAADRLYLTRGEKAILTGGSGVKAFSVSTYGATGYLGAVDDAEWT